MRELKSDNYNPGLQGWRISANGEAEFQDGVFRGTIKSSSGEIGGWKIKSDMLESESGYHKVQILTVTSDEARMFKYYGGGVLKAEMIPHSGGEGGWTIGGGVLYLAPYYNGVVHIVEQSKPGYSGRGSVLIVHPREQKIYSWCHFEPGEHNVYDLGTSYKKWANIYRTNEFSCALPTSNSAINVIKKIKSPKIKNGDFGKRHYFEVEDFPEEMKAKNNEGEMDIEFTRTTGILVQAIKEIVERLQKLEYGKGSK